MEYKSWRDFIESQAEESYFRRLMNFVDQERQIKDIYPPRKICSPVLLRVNLVT